jgi:hypothetical protein
MIECKVELLEEKGSELEFLINGLREEAQALTDFGTDMPAQKKIKSSMDVL